VDAARSEDRRDANGSGTVKFKLLWREVADQGRFARRVAAGYGGIRCAGEADAHIGVPTHGWAIPEQPSSAGWPIAAAPSAIRAHHQLQIAQRHSASCICRKSAGGFFL
jgi:hypothetical protein